MITKKFFAFFLLAHPTISLATYTLSTGVDFNYFCKFKENIALQSSEDGCGAIAFLQDSGAKMCRIWVPKIPNTKGILFSIDEGVNIHLQIDNNGGLIALGKIKSETGLLLLQNNNHTVTLATPSNLASDCTTILSDNQNTANQVAANDRNSNVFWTTTTNDPELSRVTNEVSHGQELSIDITNTTDYDIAANAKEALRAESGGGIIINGPGFGSIGVVHNDNTGALSSSLIIDSDITLGTIASDKLADATLIALANYNTNGLLTQTAPDTFTGRTITGTANQITVTNGDGVAGNPTLAFASPLTFDDLTLSGNLTVNGTSTLTGNVGIGQAPASDALTVLGSIKATESLVYTNDSGSGTSLIAAGSAQANTRLEWANITGSNGNIISSSGTIASVRNSTGNYTITITPGLKIDPAVLVTIKSAVSLGSGVYAITDTVSTNATSTVIAVRIYVDGLLTLVSLDANFSILAVGIQ